MQLIKVACMYAIDKGNAYRDTAKRIDADTMINTYNAMTVILLKYLG